MAFDLFLVICISSFVSPVVVVTVAITLYLVLSLSSVVVSTVLRDEFPEYMMDLISTEPSISLRCNFKVRSAL